MTRKTSRRTPFDPIVIPPYSLGGFNMCGCAGPGHRWDCMTMKPSPLRMMADYAKFAVMTAIADGLDAWRRFTKDVDWFRLGLFAAVVGIYCGIASGLMIGR